MSESIWLRGLSDDELVQARADFAEACKKLEMAELAICCATKHETVLRAVDAARQALQILIACSEVIHGA